MKLKSGYVCEHNREAYLHEVGPATWCQFCGSLKVSEWMDVVCHRPGPDPDECAMCGTRVPEGDLQQCGEDGPDICPRCFEEAKAEESAP